MGVANYYFFTCYLILQSTVASERKISSPLTPGQAHSAWWELRGSLPREHGYFAPITF